MKSMEGVPVKCRQDPKRHAKNHADEDPRKGQVDRVGKNIQHFPHATEVPLTSDIT